MDIFSIKGGQYIRKFEKHFSFSHILRQEPAARQEGLFEARLPLGPLTSLSSIVLELSVSFSF